ncbi:MAG: hypothetical protein EOP85_18190 [Verrucomicrobiaceae bacterium]|nr:MAG: hypothetical protein EOP85_18190 [Verrucomicrobiaceae bacterium]
MALFKEIDKDPVRQHSPIVPEEFNRPGEPLDPQAAHTFLATHRDLIDRLRAIGLMMEHSSDGYEPVDRPPNPYNLLWGGELLLLDARLDVAQGDRARALETMRALQGLSDHLTGVSSAGTLEACLAGALHQQVRLHLMESILPSLPADQIDLASWEAEMGALPARPKDYAGLQRGDWNSMMSELLPALVDTSDVSVPADADLLVEIYTRHMREMASLPQDVNLGEMADHDRSAPSVDHLSWRGRDLASGLGLKERDVYFRDLWQTQQASAGMTQAAFAILHGKPVPNDPVSGLPYQWNPATRELSMPDTPRYREADIGPVKVPNIR